MMIAPPLPARRPRAALLVCVLLLQAMSSMCAADGSSDEPAAATGGSSKKTCQTLHTSMTYSQDKAPRDISAVVSSDPIRFGALSIWRPVVMCWLRDGFYHDGVPRFMGCHMRCIAIRRIHRHNLWVLTPTYTDIFSPLSMHPIKPKKL
jgi:hypothetical protein